jgi:hypothetical protein
MKTKHAAIYYLPDGSSCLAWIENGGFHKERLANHCRTIYELAEAAYPHFVSHLWILPAYGTFEAVPSNADWNISVHQPKKKRGIMSVSIFKHGHQIKDLEVVFPQGTSWWGTEVAPGWMRACDAQELLITLHYMESVLGVTVTASPGRTGWNFLKKIHPEWIEEIGIDLKACHFDNKSSADIIWQRPLLANERKGYIHKFDKSAAYPYAAATTDIGAGTPIHQNHGEGADAMNNNQCVGVWRCTVQYVPTYDPLMPWVWKENIRRDSRKVEDEWLAGPIIRLLRKVGHTVTVHEGYVFPEKHDVMVRWTKNLWKARLEYNKPRWVNRKCAKLAQQGIKQIMNTTIGSTAFKNYDDDDDMKRPDIRMQVIARHRELMWHNIDAVRRAHQATPVIVYMDAIYMISDNPNGRQAFPKLVEREFEEDGTTLKLGGFKYEGRVELTPDVLAMFNSSMSESSRLEYLNKKGWIA